MTDTEILAKVQHAMKPGETLDAFLKRAGFTNRNEIAVMSAAEITRYAAVGSIYKEMPLR